MGTRSLHASLQARATRNDGQAWQQGTRPVEGSAQEPAI